MQIRDKPLIPSPSTTVYQTDRPCHMDRAVATDYWVDDEGRFMSHLKGTFYLGQFILDRCHRVIAWDQDLEHFSCIPAGEVLGTSDHWRIFYPSPRTTFVDYFLNKDFFGAESCYGASTIMHIADRGWALLHPFPQTSDPDRLLLIWVTPHEDGGAIQALYNADYLNSFINIQDDRYQGLRILAEQAPAGVCLIQDGKVVLANRYLSFIFGYGSPEEMINEPSTSVLIKSEHQKHLDLLANLHRKKDAGRGRYQWNGVDKLGRKIWFEAQPTPIQWNGRPAVLSLVVDITDFKQREAAMKKAAESLQQENEQLRSSIDCRIRMSNIIGKSAKIQTVFDLAQRSAQQGSTTIIYGETGTGKELVAEAIHSLSDRSDGPFVPVNCAAIPGELFEREFFGHIKGAFTGAHSDKPGLLKSAHRGTLFLDEVGELDLGAQSKLLRALDSGEYTPIGSQKRETSDFQLVAATNRDLEAMVRKGTFRQDLFYRIHIVPIEVPPLRERKEDIPFLVEHFLSHFDTVRRMPSINIAKLLLYNWPGNVRELQNVVERYVAMGNLDFLGLEEIDTPSGLDRPLGDVPLREALDRYEQQLITATLEKYSGNRTQTAMVLGLPRKTLFRKMKKHHIGYRSSLFATACQNDI